MRLQKQEGLKILMKKSWDRISSYFLTDTENKFQILNLVIHYSYLLICTSKMSFYFQGDMTNFSVFEDDDTRTFYESLPNLRVLNTSVSCFSISAVYPPVFSLIFNLLTFSYFSQVPFKDVIKSSQSPKTDGDSPQEDEEGKYFNIYFQFMC